MKKFFLVLITLALTSFVVFPFSFTFFPVQNTKNILAAVGVVLYALELADKRRVNAEKGTILVFLAALAVSLMAVFTMFYHNTADATYVSFPITLILWLSASYVCLKMMRVTHGYASAELVTLYMTAVAVLQCIIALLISSSPAFENFVCSWMAGGEDYWKSSGRMYGIGCGLDVAGVRLSALLVMLSYLCYEASRGRNRKKLFLLLAGFAIITVVGNMISRTTIVGTAGALAIWLLLSLIPTKSAMHRISSLWGYLLLVIALTSGICAVLYNTNEKAREDLRFGFEGFFSIVEKGHWETHSNNELKKMVKWPDNTATWMLGDGYMLDPTDVEDYLQTSAGDYVYQGTDIGYCRFIFYFGLVGLAVMIMYFAVAAGACAARAPSKKLAFFFLFVVNLVVWAKVTTDIFAVMVFFLLSDIETDEEEDEDEEENEEENEDNILHTLPV